HARHMRALADDCEAAQILVLTFARPEACAPQGQVIDARAVRDRGAHAVYVSGGTARVVAVDDARGDRPWVVTGKARRAALRQLSRVRGRRGSRTAAFATPALSGNGSAQPRGDADDGETPQETDAFGLQ
ncbi:MAG: hypothetical protein AAFV26_07945, partial [Pseudomonadota bacterium]